MWGLGSGCSSLCQLCTLQELGTPDGAAWGVTWVGWMGWMVAVFAQRLCKAPQSNVSPESLGKHSWMTWEGPADILPGWHVSPSQPSHWPPDHPAKQLSGSPVPVSRHHSSEPLSSPSLPSLRFAECHFLSQFPTAVTKGKPNTFMLLQTLSITFCASTFYRFLNLGLDWKSLLPFSYTNVQQQVWMDCQPQQPRPSSSICPALSFPSSLPSSLPTTVLWPLQGTPLSVVRYRRIQLTLNSILTFGDIHVHSSKTSFLKSNLYLFCTQSLAWVSCWSGRQTPFKTFPLFAAFFWGQRNKAGEH